MDNNAAALLATTQILGAAGYEVLQATTAAAALALAASAELIVLDVKLPDMDGFEVCRRLRARADTARIPILHLSATFTQATDVALGLEAGADSYLTHPVEAPVLLATVKTLLFARRAEQLRRGTHARLAAMFELAPAAVAVLDTALRHESVNPGYCALTGYLPDELVGTSAAMLLNLPEKPSTALSGLTTLERKDGSTALVDWKMATEPISSSHILVLTDVTNKARLDAERESLLARERIARSEAERSNRLKEEFLATLSHELRNPLNAILGWATLLSRTKDLPAPVVRAVAAIERNSRLQAQMIADLLDYAGIAFGKLRLNSSTLDPYPVVRAALDVVQASATAAEVTVHSSFGEDGTLVEADPGRLQQIVWNLLSNAIKFSRKGGEVRIDARTIGEEFQISVRDRGAGITSEFLPRIFERFSQEDASSTRSHGGLGLGLAIVKQLVTLQGGSITASSEGPGHGATFVVTLPISTNVELPTLSDSQILRSSDLSDVIALVVEDDVDTRDLTKRILTDAGAQVVEAASADAALSCIPTSRANILISDIGMAGTDGYQLLRRLRASGYGPDRLPALALTAFARMQDRNDSLAAGFQDHLVKPVDAQILIARVGKLRRRALARVAPSS
ncbi:MAG TPA: response regulator [Steroidobacteraceae bacterium]